MKIAHIDLGKYPILLAPMEDVTDPAFRLMCKKFGADMVYTEFVSSDALIRAVSKAAEKGQEQECCRIFRKCWRLPVP